MLAPSLAIRGGPAEQALQSKDDKAKLEAAIRAEVQGQQPPPAGTPPAGTTTTVTTQSAPPSQGPTGQSPPPSIKGPTSHHRKPPGT